MSKKIEFNIDETGNGKLIVGGNDISNYITGFSIACEAGDPPPEVEITLRSQLTGTVKARPSNIVLGEDV